MSNSQETFRPYAGAVGAETLQEVEEWLEAENKAAHSLLPEFRDRFGTYHDHIVNEWTERPSTEVRYSTPTAANPGAYSEQEIQDLEERIGEAVGHPEGCTYTLKATALEVIEHLATRNGRCEGFTRAPRWAKEAKPDPEAPLPYKVEQEVKAAAEAAMDRFWEEVAARFPDAKSGDFDPMALAHFENVCEAAIRAWVRWNVTEDMTAE